VYVCICIYVLYFWAVVCILFWLNNVFYNFADNLSALLSIIINNNTTVHVQLSWLHTYINKETLKVETAQ